MEVAALGLRIDGVMDIDSASSSLDKFQKSAAKAENSADSFGQGTGKAFAAASKSLTGFEALAARAAKETQYLARQVQKLSEYDIRNNDIQAYGAELDRLRAKYNPLFAASKAYEVELDELNRAHRVGAINAQEHANALNTLNARFAQSGAAANTAKVNYQALGGGMGGLAAQFQDIGVTAAMGMNPLIIGLQQGTQIAGQMEAAMSRGASAVGVFSTAFKSLLGPVTAASIGLTVLASALIQAVDWAKLGKTALNALADAIEVIAPYAAVAGAAIAALYAPTILSGLASLSTAIFAVSKSVATLIAASMVANPFAWVVVGVAAAVAALYVFRDAVKSAIGVDVIDIVKTGANYVINSFVAAYEDIKFVWSNFGNIMGAAVIGGVNIAITAINKLIQKAVEGINGLIGLIREIPGLGDTPLVGQALGISEIANPYAKVLEGSVAERNKKLAEIMGRDSVGAFIKGASEAGDKAADWLRKLTFGDDKKGKTRNSELQNLIKNLEIQYATLGMTAEQAGRYEIQAAKGTETDRKRALALYDQIQAWKETEKAMQQAIDSGRQYLAFQREMEVFQQQANLRVAAVGLGDRQREFAEQELSIRQEYAQKRLELEQAQQVATTALEQSQYEERLRLLQQAEDQKLAIVQSANQSRLAAEGDWTNGANRALENYLESAANVAAQTESLFTNALGTMTSSFGEAFESMVFDSESLGDAVRGLAQSMARAIINALGQMAAQWLAYQAVQLVTGKTAQASAASTLTANATATSLQAGLAAFASTAAIPIVGPFLAPAAMAAALAATAPVAAAVSAAAWTGMAHDGIDSVPETGTWLLQKGERVTTANTSAKLDSVLERIDARQRGARASQQEAANQNFRKSSPTVNLIEDRSRAGTVQTREGVDRDEIIDIFVADIRGGGRSADAIEMTYPVRRMGR